MAIIKEIEDIVEPFRWTLHGPLAQCYPEVAAYWCYEKNCGFGPEDFGPGADVRVWWICVNNKEHVFKQAIGIRVRAERDRSADHGCSFCRGYKPAPSNYLANYPKLAKEWMTQKNGKPPEQVVAGSNFHGWWRCSKCHAEWRASPDKRVKSGRNCPYCSGNKVNDDNSLAACFPEIASQWHKKKNGKLTPHDVVFGSSKKVWWQCGVDKSHVWQVAVQSRTFYKTGCPCCRNLKLAPSNCLQHCYPKIAKEWHPTKNGDLTPNDVVAVTTKRHWWLGRCGHAWREVVRHRTVNGRGCPICKPKLRPYR